MASVLAAGSVFADTDAEILERIRPIGKVNVQQASEPAAPAPASQQAPESAPGPDAAAESAPAPAPAVEQPAPVETAAASAGGAVDGKKTYDSVCFVCHMAGVSNAPKLGDKAAWESRIAKGMDVLVQSVINGIPGTAMPPKGTCAACSEAELTAAVEYMVSQVQ
jgi:cytochrome c5